MGCQVLEYEQGTPEWHQWRATGIGASDASALFQESPYTTLRELYLLKKGAIPEWVLFGENDYIYEKGHRAEERMRAEYFALTGQVFVPQCVENPRYPFLIASLDGLFRTDDGKLRIFEAKLVGSEALELIILTNQPLRHHFIQIQQQLLLTEAEFCVYFAQDLEGNAATVIVYPDQEFQKELLEKRDEFRNYLIHNQEPPMTKDDFLYLNDPKEFEQLALLESKKAFAKQEFEAAEEAYKEELKRVASQYEHNICCVDAGIKIKRMERQGNIAFMEIPEVKALGQGYLDQFRKTGSKYFQAWFKKAKGA